jgi:hypothetical protein
MKRILTFVVLTLVIAIPAVAQSTPVDPVVKMVQDRRTGGHFASLTLSLELPKIKSSQVAASRVLVSAAADDAGNSLIDSEAQEPELEPNMRGSSMGGGPEDSPVLVSVNLKNPARKAAKVKEVRGEVELFMPSKDPNSVAEVPKFLSFSGKALNHKALKANGVEIVLVSKAQIEAERKKIADAKRKEYKEAGYEDGEDLENMVKGIMEYTLNVEPTDVPVRIKDPNKRIQEMEYVDAAGEVKRVHARDLHEDIRSITTWGEAPGADWRLRVKMKTPKNVVRHSFVVRDVALP